VDQIRFELLETAAQDFTRVRGGNGINLGFIEKREKYLRTIGPVFTILIFEGKVEKADLVSPV